LKIIYAKKSSGIEDQGSFQNPEYYEKPDLSAKSVVIVGDYPKIKADYEELDVEVEVRELPKAKPLIVDETAKISPELQKVIDDAKAECEKTLSENNILKEQLATSQGEFIAFKNDPEAMKARVIELEANADKTDEEKPKTTKPK